MTNNTMKREDEPKLSTMEMQQLPLRLGTVVCTARARALDPSDVSEALLRHQVADWGDVCRHDWLLNNAALVERGRVLSAYRTIKGEEFWIITEWDRSYTTVLLPSEY